MSESDRENEGYSTSRTSGSSRGYSHSSGESHTITSSESTTHTDRDRKAFADLVTLAEKVQAQRDVLRRQMQVSLGGGAFIFLAAMSIILTVSIGRYPLGGASMLDFLLTSPAGIMAMLFALAAYVGTTFVYMQMSRRLRRENRAFEEVMSVVHEVFEGLKSDLSPLELAETRIRLSRLDN